MEKVHAGQVASEDAPGETPALPERVQAALGELVGAAREGLLALSVGVGLSGRLPFSSIGIPCASCRSRVCTRLRTNPPLSPSNWTRTDVEPWSGSSALVKRVRCSGWSGNGCPFHSFGGRLSSMPLTSGRMPSCLRKPSM